MASSIAIWAISLAAAIYTMRQCRKPTGWLGRFMVWGMNRSHLDLTTWGLGHVEVRRQDTVLDVGCGGGRTVQRLAAMADAGKVCGVDYAPASVAASAALNRAAIAEGRVEIQRGSVSQLPYSSDTFDLVTAVETHYYWPDLPGDVRQILRVLKPGGAVLIVAEAYRGGRFDRMQRGALKLIGGDVLSVEEYRELLAKAGFIDVGVLVEAKKGWICATGRKPFSAKDEHG